MRAEYYADEFRRYATYCRHFNGGDLYRIAGGPHDEDYHWTEVCMREASRRRMQGLSLHYYSHIQWENKKSAVDFGESEWFILLKKGLTIDPIIRQHSAIMDRYDPERHIGLVVDEWGTWHAAEPGTNPAFLYQQNTLRDAILAGISLHIFHNHCERVHMANIAQTINVLQAMILTDGPKMILTPTYHVFEMFKGHQDATRLPIALQSEDYTFGEDAIPQVSASASRNPAGEILVTACNLNPHQPTDLLCTLHGATVGHVEGRVLTAAAMNALNSFDAPDTVRPVPFDGANAAGSDLKDHTAAHVRRGADAQLVASKSNTPAAIFATRESTMAAGASLPDGAGGGDEVGDVGMIPGVLTVIHILDYAVLIDDKRAGQHLRIADGCALRTAAREGSDTRADNAGRDQLIELSLPQTIRVIGGRRFVGEARHAGCEFAAVPLGVFGLSHRHADNLQARLLQPIPVKLQLSQPFAAEQSAKMPQERQERGPTGPQICQMDRLIMHIC